MKELGTILVVDDDPSSRLLIEGVLKAAGYRTASASGGAEALTLLEGSEWDFDLLVTDKNMSGMDGHTLINEAVRRRPKMGAVIVTAYRTEESARMAFSQHVLSYIEKPIYDIYRVTQAVEAALKEQRKRIGASA